MRPAFSLRGRLAPRSLAACAALALGLAATPALATWHLREEIPVESPVYRMAADLATSYRVTSGLLLTRPWTRADLGLFLDQLVADEPRAALDPAVQRLRRELEPGGGILGREPMFATDLDESSIEISPYVRGGYAEDRARDSTVSDFRAGLQGSFAFGEHTVLYADGYVGSMTPGAHGTPDADGSFRPSNSDLTVWFDRIYAVWQSRGFTARAGHTWLSWGPGMAGTLALGDAAPAFDLVEGDIGLSRDARLLWFVGVLDPIGQTYMAGHRLALRAGPSVELGISELARFDGAGNVPLYLIPIMPYALLDRRAKGSSELPAGTLDTLAQNNIMFSTDFSWTWRPGARFYGELLIDDVSFSNERPLAAGWQAGLHLRRMLGGAAWALRGDYTRVYRYVYAVYHDHDFIHAGFPTGFPLGADVEQFTARLEWRPNAAWAWGAEWLSVRKGSDPLGAAWQPGSPVPANQVLTSPLEVQQRAILTADWSPSPSVTISGAGGLAKLQGRNHVVGDDGDGPFGRAAATFRW